MKKLLSLVLAVIMVLSIMPMAYAERATYSPEIEEYIEDYIRAGAYFNNQYKTYEQKMEVESIITEAISGKTEISLTYDDLTNIEADGCLEELTAFHECFKKAITEVEKKIADGEIVVVIDIYDYLKYLLAAECYYSEEYLKEFGDRIENCEKFINAKAEAENALDAFVAVQCGEYTGTQADFEADMEPLKHYYSSVYACLDGNHPYGEYISNNDATEEADGTKTATCEFCGLTNTITDEGTKLPKKEATLYEMIFDLIKDFFELIFSMFK